MKSVSASAFPAGFETRTFPLVALDGTIARIFVSESIMKLGEATALKVTFVAQVNSVPRIVTSIPRGPLVGEKNVMVGGGITVKSSAPTPVPNELVTEMGPVVAPAGTMAVICESEFTAKLIATVLLNCTPLALLK